MDETRSFGLNLYIEWLEAEWQRGSPRYDQFSIEYMKSHQARYRETIRLLEGHIGARALEIGATDFFQVFLKIAGQFEDVWGTIFSPDVNEKNYRKHFSSAGFETISRIVSLDLERELFPVQDGFFDLVMFCEVVEHMDIDPMFCLIEINRILKNDGILILTTPNSCSARIAYKACLGYRPHFFMQYEKSRSPYRHNFEYDVHTINALLEGAGFVIEVLETHDVFESTHVQAVEFLKRNNMPLHHRGDDIFVVARKASAPINRWPEELYV